METAKRRAELARRGDEDMTEDQRTRRSVGRTVTNWFVILLSLVVIGGWLTGPEGSQLITKEIVS